jgi:hypothetical protein
MLTIAEDPAENEFFPSEYDLSAGPAIQTQQSSKLSLEESIEAIMERCFAEKASTLADIRVKYEVKIRKKESLNCYIDVIDLQEKMESELARMSSKLDEKRR